ncbi:glycosyl transferase family 90 [Marinoscillum pacificum]|uniref:glycosyl transferase family 90 n=1 Tax=Marinoscillum pacificum TaxID=392723 RepID=UPI00215861FC|nr:glycosyl transferase family 90 [Marinoscillum pacificum]
MQEKKIDKSQWIDPEERIEYYLNNKSTIELDLNLLESVQNLNSWTKKEVKYISYKDFKNSFLHWYCKNLMHLPLIRDIRTLPFYNKYRDLHSLIDFFRPFDQFETNIENVKFPIFYGEHGETGTLPIIRKARQTTDKTSTLYDLRSLRFNTPCVEVSSSDIPWNKKNNNVIWRGATTGSKTRESFVKKYFDNYDIGFSNVKQKPHLEPFKKNTISIAEQLKSKFIVSLQGNDIASNIRWTLFSNSVLIMPKPKWTSWAMDEKLNPQEHYLELNDDLSNLEDLLEWAQSNDSLCQQIAQNGKNFISQVLDSEYDDQIRFRLLDQYANRLKIIN